MRVIVTGATGLVGRHAVERLSSAGHQVTAVARRALQATWPPGVHPASVDLLHATGLVDVLRCHDCIVHAAGPVADATGPAALRAVHVEGTTRLAEAAIAADVRVMVYVSTLAVMAPPTGGTALDERSPLREHFPEWMHYAEAKRDAERVLKAHALDGLLRVCVLRPGIVLGAGDRYTTPRMLAALKRGWPVCIGSGAQRPPCICASDLAQAVAAAILEASSEHEVFLLAGPEPLTQAELWQYHAQAAGLDVPRGHIPAPLAMVVTEILEYVGARARWLPPANRFDLFALSTDVRVDSSKAMQRLGWRPHGAYADAIHASVQGVSRARVAGPSCTSREAHESRRR